MTHHPITLILWCLIPVAALVVIVIAATTMWGALTRNTMRDPVRRRVEAETHPKTGAESRGQDGQPNATVTRLTPRPPRT